PGQLCGAALLDQGAEAVGVADVQLGGRVLAAAAEAAQQGVVAGVRPAGARLPLLGTGLGILAHGLILKRNTASGCCPPAFVPGPPIILSDSRGAGHPVAGGPASIVGQLRFVCAPIAPTCRPRPSVPYP